MYSVVLSPNIKKQNKCSLNLALYTKLDTYLYILYAMSRTPYKSLGCQKSALKVFFCFFIFLLYSKLASWPPPHTLDRFSCTRFKWKGCGLQTSLLMTGDSCHRNIDSHRISHCLLTSFCSEWCCLHCWKMVTELASFRWSKTFSMGDVAQFSFLIQSKAPTVGHSALSGEAHLIPKSFFWIFKIFLQNKVKLHFLDSWHWCSCPCAQFA